eukprot:2865011-Alexandrium_andersonii.AAC.1
MCGRAALQSQCGLDPSSEAPQATAFMITQTPPSPKSWCSTISKSSVKRIASDPTYGSLLLSVHLAKAPS